MKIPLALGAATLALGLLTGCGGSSDDAYCQDVKAARKQFDAITSNDVTQLDPAFKRIHALRAESPDDLKGDWKTVDTAVQGVSQAFEDAGVKLSDFGKIQNQQLPKDIDTKKLQAVASKYAALGSPEFTKAWSAIVTHAKDTCKVTVGG